MSQINAAFHLKRLYFPIANALQRAGSRPMRVLSIQETLAELRQSKVSIARFGDGEIRLVSGNGIEFQEFTPALQAELAETLLSSMPKLLICLSPVFGRLKDITVAERTFWRRHLTTYRAQWMKYAGKRRYGNTFVTRPYMPFADKSSAFPVFQQWKEIWKGRDLLIVEGHQTRFGSNNDLLAGAASIHRILCPATDAYGSANEIFQDILKHGSEKLVLLALGPTATVLAYRLAKAGIRAIDIGHLDIEYEWMLRTASGKIEIPGKYTNEVEYDKRSIAECNDSRYLSEIITRINC